MKIDIRNARVIDPGSGRDERTPVFVAEGRIVAIGKAPDGFRPDRSIDATGLVACPGLVDLAARLREPGFEYRATLASEMQAAVAGGVTSLACPPDTDPPLDEPGLVEMLRRRAGSLQRSRVYPLGALTLGLRGEKIAEMGELTDAGCVGFFQADAPLTDLNVLLQAMRYAATFGYAVWLRPQDAHLARGGVAHEGEVSTRLGLPPIPEVAETVALLAILELAETTGARVHLARLSTAKGVALVAAAKARGLAITCDVGVHHLHLCDRDAADFNANMNLVPPLRDPGDRDALRRALADGTIDAVCSDHTPVDDDAKQVPFGEAEPGATGLELLLPLVLKWGAEMKLPLGTSLSAATSRPAAVLGIEAGSLAVGRPADLCLFDPGRPWVLTPGALASQGKNSPFMGLELIGRVTTTIVDGRVVYPG
jgi:dihydroorotase